MAEKRPTSFRIHPRLRLIVREFAESRNESESYMLEEIVCEQFKDKLPLGFRPGQRVSDEDEELYDRLERD